MKWLRNWVFERMCYVIANRTPDFEVGPEGAPYLKRWYLLPRKQWRPNLYLHWFQQSDYDKALHDHPGWNVSWLISGDYIEVVPGALAALGGPERKIFRAEGSIVFRRAADAHRVELFDQIVATPGGNRHRLKSPVLTLFVMGPTRRVWGFHCPSGWRPFKDVTNLSADGKRSTMGRGCS